MLCRYSIIGINIWSSFALIVIRLSLVSYENKTPRRLALPCHVKTILQYIASQGTEKRCVVRAKVT